MAFVQEVPGCFDFLRRRNRGDRTASQCRSPTALGSSNETAPKAAKAIDTWTIAANSEEGLTGPPAYSSEASRNERLFDEDAIQTVEEKIDELNADLRKLSLDIHDHPEICYQEKYAHDALTKFMESRGFEVTRHYLGLETAWLATFKVGDGGRVLGFNSEMDALPGIGHACGHNLIAIGGVAAALGVPAALKKHNIAGTVALIGTPAEERGVGKARLLEKGAYKGFAACLMIHPGPGPPKFTGTSSSLALTEVLAEFHGQTAHAAAAPWEGRNALDSAFVAYSAISALRQQIKPTHRMHGVVEGRDWAPNVIPDYAKMNYYIRAPTYNEVDALELRLKACFEAAAHATNCKLDYTNLATMYDLFQNDVLAAEYKTVCESRYKLTVDTTAADGGGSTDFGNISYALPGLHPGYSIPTEPGGGNHTRSFTAAARTIEAHEATLVAAKGIAVTGLRVLTDDDFAKEVKRFFDGGKQ